MRKVWMLFNPASFSMLQERYNFIHVSVCRFSFFNLKPKFTKKEML